MGIDCEYRLDRNYFYGTRPLSRKMHLESYYQLSNNEFGGIGRAFEEDGRKVWNATKGGKLDSLDRINLEDII